MRLAHAFRRASGPSLQDCHFLADRWDGKGWVEDHAESWVGQLVEGQVFLLLGQVGWLTGLWRSPSGTVYVAEGSHRRGGVHINASTSPQRPDWKFHELPCLAMGIWGLSDQFVLAWGPRRDKEAEAFFQWDGRQWQEWASPGEVIAVHGLAPDFVYAVGREGLIAHWNGAQWRNVPSFTQAALTDVHVVSQDEIYACGDAGILEGSVYGWSELLESPGHVSSVVKHGGQVWLAGEGGGLLTLQGRKLEEAEPSLKATALEARGALLVTTPNALADSEDGKEFRRLPLEAFSSRLLGVPRKW